MPAVPPGHSTRIGEPESLIDVSTFLKYHRAAADLLGSDRGQYNHGEKRVRRLLTAIAAGVAAVGLLTAPAGAVQGGTPDGNGHPNVGLSVFYYHGVPLWRCSGTMVAAKVYVTAGHCTGIDPSLGIAPDHAEVWFDSGPILRGKYPGTGSCAGYTGYPCKGDIGGLPHPHPGWNGFLTFPNTHDMGVVVLDSAPSKGLSKIAPSGYLDGLANKGGPQNANFPGV